MSKRILVVEDQPDNRQIIRDMLARTDYEITEAKDGGGEGIITGDVLDLTPDVAAAFDERKRDHCHVSALCCRRLPVAPRVARSAPSGLLKPVGADSWRLSDPRIVQEPRRHLPWAVLDLIANMSFGILPIGLSGAIWKSRAK